MNEEEKRISEEEARKIVGQLTREEKLLLRALLLDLKQPKANRAKAG